MITLIAAVANNRVIGYKGRIPWYLPEDLKTFKKITQKPNSIILVGVRTWEILPESMKHDNRQYRIVRRFDIERKKEFIESLTTDNIFVIGGQYIYDNFIDVADIIIKTDVFIDVVGDRYFPIIRDSDWEIYHQTGIRHANDNIQYRYGVYRRKSEEYEYLNILVKILSDGDDRGNTRSIFGTMMKFSLLNGNYPLITTKKMYFKGIVEELLWFLRGETNVKTLRDKGVHIWDGNTNRAKLNSLGLNHLEEYDGGPIYGFNFRHYGDTYVNCHTTYTKGIDQLSNAIDAIKKEKIKLLSSEIYKPNRRIIINLWNPSQLDEVSLPACHIIYQFYLHCHSVPEYSFQGKDYREDKIYLSCSLYQRSGDMGLGVPFNIASASLLTIIIAHFTDTIPCEFTHTIGDAHIYNDHIPEIKKQLLRTPLKFPTIKIIGNPDTIDNLKFRNFDLCDYHHHDKVPLTLITT